MTDSRARRLRALADLIRLGQLVSQEEVTERLASLGFAVTQATVSRDLEQLGAVKVKRGGILSYALPADASLQALAVTEEPAGGMPQPTGRIVILASAR